MFVEPNLKQVEEVTAKNVAAQRSGTESRMEIEASEFTVGNDDRQDARVQRNAVDKSERKGRSLEEVQSNIDRQLPVEERIFGPRIEFGIGFQSLRTRRWMLQLDH